MVSACSKHPSGPVVVDGNHPLVAGSGEPYRNSWRTIATGDKSAILRSSCEVWDFSFVEITKHIPAYPVVVMKSEVGCKAERGSARLHYAQKYLFTARTTSCCVFLYFSFREPTNRFAYRSEGIRDKASYIGTFLYE